MSILRMLFVVEYFIKKSLATTMSVKQYVKTSSSATTLSMYLTKALSAYDNNPQYLIPELTTYMRLQTNRGLLSSSGRNLTGSVGLEPLRNCDLASFAGVAAAHFQCTFHGESSRDSHTPLSSLSDA